MIFVMGAGRSGSTILGVALGNCADMFYAGELDKWLPRSGTPKLAGAEREEFWLKVREQVPEAESLFGHEAHRHLERSSALLRRGRRGARRRLRDRYLRVAAGLYRAIAQTAGAGYVVDTSHYPLRARELQALDDIDLYLLFLVRDPRDVVASFARQDVPEPTFNELTTNAYLWLTHVIASIVFLRHPRERRLLVRHEDLLADPDGVLGAILRQVGSSASPPDLEHLQTGFPLVGNRLIGSDVVALQRRARSAPRSAPLTTLLQLPWMAFCTRLRPVARASSQSMLS
ncbi:MAG: sulfotransferase [Solirubrobacteraceae bacterium]